jgi:phosphoadenosine phosphosulfate reductase
MEIASLFPGKSLFTTSFGIEDQVISHLIFENDIPMDVATLDTGRLFPQTYKVFNETLKKYHKRINIYFPDHEAVETMMTEKGPFSFYHSRKQTGMLQCKETCTTKQSLGQRVLDIRNQSQPVG